MAKYFLQLGCLVFIFMPSLTSMAIAQNQFRDQLENEQDIWIRMDKCSGKIGSIVCGEDYRVSYTANRSPMLPWCETVRGPADSRDNIIDKGGYCNGNPEANTISIFGATFSFNEKGDVFYIVNSPQGAKAVAAGTMRLKQ